MGLRLPEVYDHQKEITPMNPPTTPPEGPTPSDTPGPWTVEDAGPLNEGFRIFCKTRYVGFVGNSDISKEEAEANARLIAQAPTLATENVLLRQALRDVTGNQADYVAHDLDHGNFRRNKWWKMVLKARRLLATLTPEGEVRG